jgi:hypothetical protein
VLVVDKGTHSLHFFTVEPGQEAGAELHLRGKIDLTQVGTPLITPKKTAK